MMNLNLPGGGLGRGRVWRSQAWVSASGRQKKPWLGTLDSGLSAIGGPGRAPTGGSCLWAGGNDLPYIQQRFTSDTSDTCSLSGDFSLPSPTSPFSGDHQHKAVTSSPTVADDVFDDVRRHSKAFEASRRLYVLLDGYDNSS